MKLKNKRIADEFGDVLLPLSTILISRHKSDELLREPTEDLLSV